MRDYEYRGLLASTWDLLRADTPHWPDRAFYLDLIGRFGQPVLDVGCGTGRLLLDYLTAGIDIEGVDCSPEMLALCQRKAAERGLQPRLYEQSMEALDLPRAYRTVLVASSSFQLLTAPAAAQRAMARFSAHLLAGGALVMPFVIPWRDGEPRETGWKVREKIRPDDGAVVRRRFRSWYDAAAQLEHTEDVYEVLQAGAVIASEHHRRSPAVRWYSQAECRALFAAAGFADVHLYANFTFQPAEDTDRLFTAVGIRP